MQDSLRRDDLKASDTSSYLQYSAGVQRALKRAATRGAVNLTEAQVQEIDRDWVMVGSVQIAVNTSTHRAFRL